MTLFVVDASIAVCWLMPDERHPVAETAWRRLARDGAIAPSLWWFELRNVLVVNERRGRLDAAKTAQALRLLEAAGRTPRRQRRKCGDAGMPGYSRELTRRGDLGASTITQTLGSSCD